MGLDKNFVATRTPSYFSGAGKIISLTVAAASSSPYAFPDVTKTSAATVVTSIAPCTGGVHADALAAFQAFWDSNPFHIKRLNIYFSAQSAICSGIVVKTPNVFSGTIEQQYIDVSASMLSTQQQSQIVTIDCDIYISRNSYFSFIGGGGSGTTMRLDLSIDYHISLEKALQENIIIANNSKYAEETITSEEALTNYTMPLVEVSKPIATVDDLVDRIRNSVEDTTRSRIRRARVSL